MKELQGLLNGFLGSLQGDQSGNAAARGGQQSGGQQSGGQQGVAGGLLGGNLGQLAGAAGVGGLAGLLMGSKGGRKFMGKAASYGGLALLGGLAYKAYSDWQAGKAPASTAASTAVEPIPVPPADGQFLPPDEPDEAGAEDLSLALVRAMIAAAKADGHIDADEQRRLFEQIGSLDLTQAQKGLVMDELSKPLDMDAVVASATTPERAAEIYCASLMAIDPDGPAERGYLAFLAGRLKLDPKLVEHLHASVEGAADPAA